MNYTPKFSWVRDLQGVLHKGIKNNGFLVATEGVEIDGELAIEIERLEKAVKQIPQMPEAETKAVNPTTQSVKVEITEEEPKQIKKKNVNSFRSKK